MAIDREEVRRIARLAHLEYPRKQSAQRAERAEAGARASPERDPQDGSEEHLIDDETLAKLAADITQILEHVKELMQVDVSGVEPTSHGVPLPPVMRADETVEGIDPERLLEGVPSRAGDAVSVPKIVE